MSRPGAGLHRGKRRIVGHERPFVGVEAIDQHLVEPEIGRVREAVGGIEDDRVRMRFLLSLGFTLEPVC